jgi:hypothetical protein
MFDGGVQPDPVFSVIKGTRRKAHGARENIIKKKGGKEGRPFYFCI